LGGTETPPLSSANTHLLLDGGNVTFIICPWKEKVPCSPSAVALENSRCTRSCEIAGLEFGFCLRREGFLAVVGHHFIGEPELLVDERLIEGSKARAQRLVYGGRSFLKEPIAKASVRAETTTMRQGS